MRIHHLYSDASGESHFEDVEVEWVEETRGSKLSRRFPATGIIFRQVPPAYDLDWHPAPRRQFLVTLSGECAITVTDGECRRFGPGEFVLLEDLTGRGHRSVVTSVDDVVLLLVWLAEDGDERAYHSTGD